MPATKEQQLEEVTESIDSLERSHKVRKGRLRDTLTDPEVVHLLETNVEDPRVPWMTIYKDCLKHTTGIKDKCSNYLKVITSYRKEWKKLRALDDDLYIKIGESFQTARDDSIDLEIECEDMISKLHSLGFIAQEKARTLTELANRSQAEVNLDLEQKRELHQHRLTMEREENERKNKESEAKIAESNAKTKATEASTVNPPPPPKKLSVKLPKTELQKFNGDLWSWYSFRDEFDTHVQNNPEYDVISKFKYLRSCLEGEPYHLIMQLPQTEMNYTIAYKRLTKRYGKTDAIIKAYHHRLEKIQPATTHPSSMQKVFDELETTIEAMEALNEEVNCRPYRLLVLSKFPPEVYDYIKIRCRDTLKSMDNLDNILELIGEYIETKVEGLSYSASNISFVGEQDVSTIGLVSTEKGKPHTQTQGQRNQGQGQGRPYQPRGPHQSQGRSYNNSTPSAAGVRSAPCHFCQGEHWSDECKKYPSIAERTNQVKDRCLKCLRSGHATRNCQWGKSCFFCKYMANHHRALCPKEFPQEKGQPYPKTSTKVKRSQEEVVQISSVQSYSINYSEPADQDNCSSNIMDPYPYHSFEPDNKHNTSQADPYPYYSMELEQKHGVPGGKTDEYPYDSYDVNEKPQAMISEHEEVVEVSYESGCTLLQTAKTTVRAAEGQHLVDLTVLMDSASQRTYILQEYAKMMGLIPHYYQKLKVTSFGGSGAPLKLTCGIADIMMLCKDGSEAPLTVTIDPDICGFIHKDKLGDMVMDYISF